MGRERRSKQGCCILCGRQSRLTFHHLIPRKVHRRNRFKKQHGRTELQKGIDICQLCHWGLHNLYDEMTLAQRFSTVESLRQDDAIRKHVSWVRKQKAKGS
ncbi:MAG: hypothetical protein K0U98_11780 [Deltaproteobacteria bacterium]|nr:hypothetical protein [Deltaproteobacteria bacterium]